MSSWSFISTVNQLSFWHLFLLCLFTTLYFIQGHYFFGIVFVTRIHEISGDLRLFHATQLSLWLSGIYCPLFVTRFYSDQGQWAMIPWWLSLWGSLMFPSSLLCLWLCGAYLCYVMSLWLKNASARPLGLWSSCVTTPTIIMFQPGKQNFQPGKSSPYNYFLRPVRFPFLLPFCVNY